LNEKIEFDRLQYMLNEVENENEEKRQKLIEVQNEHDVALRAMRVVVGDAEDAAFRALKELSVTKERLETVEESSTELGRSMENEMKEVDLKCSLLLARLKEMEDVTLVSKEKMIRELKEELDVSLKRVEMKDGELARCETRIETLRKEVSDLKKCMDDSDAEGRLASLSAMLKSKEAVLDEKESAIKLLSQEKHAVELQKASSKFEVEKLKLRVSGLEAKLADQISIMNARTETYERESQKKDGIIRKINQSAREEKMAMALLEQNLSRVEREEARAKYDEEELTLTLTLTLIGGSAC